MIKFIAIIVISCMFISCGTPKRGNFVCSKESASVRGQISFVGHPECF